MVEFVDRRSGSGGEEKPSPPEKKTQAAPPPPPPPPPPQEPSVSEAGPSSAARRPSATPSPDAVAPPADFLHLCQMFFFQAMMALGEIENPMAQKSEVDLGAARDFIGFLELLELKTRGNLNDAEDRYLDECLHQARLAYVARVKAAGGAAAPRT